jgi:hypothetical protein
VLALQSAWRTWTTTPTAADPSAEPVVPVAHW